LAAPRESWASRFGFIMATVGFSVGLGNIWRFPYLTGANGGGAFLLIYVLLAIFVGVPLFTVEISLGRESQLTPIAGMRRLSGRRRSFWNLIGWLGVAAALLILVYYQLIMGWIVAYVVKAISGHLSASVQLAHQEYGAFVSHPGAVLAYTALVLGLIGIIVGRGLRDGVEWVSKWLMPLLFGSLVVLAIGSMSFDGAMKGLVWYLKPDFSVVNAHVVLAALGQVFYSVGVGMAAAFVYGSYLNPVDSDIPGGATTIVAFDTLAAFLAGLVMFPALFAFGFKPDVGPGLLFVTMSSLFARVPAGNVVGAGFFILVFIAGLTSGLALAEALTSTIVDWLGWSRHRAVWTLLAVVFALGIPIALSFGPWADVRLFGKDLFALADFVSGNVLLTGGGLLIALYAAVGWGFGSFQLATNQGAGRLRVTGAWRPFISFVIPAAVALVMLTSLSVI